MRRKSRRDCHSCSKARARKWWTDRPEQTLYLKAKQRAKQRGLPFALTLEDIRIPERCPALGIPLVPHQGAPGPSSPTLDRIDPALGYIPGNVVVISSLANRIKTDATPDEVGRVAAWMRGLDFGGQG